mmetsp:Transcript_3086/g.5443  ORF Transcript_3086/g.5443 Transcript_3086/m.5443 type:complete len:105 (-) Transcript_3086:310-624(-)|eukprot:CAMPEP_0201868074 /NCGR_PEP_ID=MMETSP0902-20130614/2106_1 /ASSEMBLY_ACC=CAM_ASM_000551 /TAXON_ID=420261 /ORGANISM="Thalassiosira antarctica, Strain CCMP982" /LENGTH=104 /DNA_ID=CAMNT_0048393365 /DNA_START=202 /DNA_END=516 /DNA_ORIENTATION=+
MESTAKNSATTSEEMRTRAVSIVDGGVIDCDCSKVDEIEYCCAGIRGKYSGEINGGGKPHGNGSFVRDNSGTPMTYVGTWKDGERVGNGGYYTNGRLLGNVVWD